MSERGPSRGLSRKSSRDPSRNPSRDPSRNPSQDPSGDLSRGLSVRGLGVARAGRAVVHDVGVRVRPGEWLAVIGPNGAGKSTLLKAVAGLLPHTGDVLVEGRPLSELTPRQLGRTLACAPQSPVLPPQMTVREYVLLGRTPHLGYLARPGRRDHEVTAGVLERLDLGPLAGRIVGRLSGGERQRVVLARALAQQAPVLLLDEPTTALDLGHQQQVLELVDRLRADDGLTVVTTLHDLGVAAQYADTLMLLVGGRAVAQGSPREVLTAELVSRHYQAEVEVLTGGDGRPRVHLVRPGHRAAASATPAGAPAPARAADRAGRIGSAEEPDSTRGTASTKNTDGTRGTASTTAPEPVPDPAPAPDLGSPR